MKNYFSFFSLVFIITFFVPDYSFNLGIPFVEMILPYFKHKVLFLVLTFYFIFLMVRNKNILFFSRGDSLYNSLMLIFIICIFQIFLTYFTISNYSSFSITNFIFPIFIISLFYHGVNFNWLLKLFLSLAKIILIFMFLELVLFQFVENKYSFSSYNGSFTSVFIQNLQTVSIICNIVFASSFYSILKSENKLYNIFFIIFSVIVCYYTYNRTAMAINFIFIFIIPFFRSGKIISPLNILLLFILLFASVYLTSIIGNIESSNIYKSDFSDINSLIDRLILFYIGSKLYIENIIFGVGPFDIMNQLSYVTSTLYNDQFFTDLILSSDSYYKIDSGLWISKPHFSPLVLVLYFGIFGIMIYFYIFKIIFKSVFFIKKNSSLILPIVLALIILSHNFMYPQILFNFMFLIIYCLKYNMIQTEIK